MNKIKKKHMKEIRILAKEIYIYIYKTHSKLEKLISRILTHKEYTTEC